MDGTGLSMLSNKPLKVLTKKNSDTAPLKVPEAQTC